jgi:hypothetical protein
MDNTNSLSDSILKSSESSMSSFGSTSYSSNENGFFDTFKNINMTTWLLIILILAFLGFNIFVYLAEGTQEVTKFFAPLIEKIFGTTVDVTSKVVDVSAEGAKAVVGGAANIIETGLSSAQDITPNGSGSSVKGQQIDQQKLDILEENNLNKALNRAASQETDYQAYEASTSVHSVGKSGWCYVGNDRGFRTCAEVGKNDSCMSGDIFPSQEICMNPSLRT